MLHAVLKVVGGKQDGKLIPLETGKFLIGREQDCHLRPGSDSVSRHHCAISIDDYTVRVRDLGSSNGTYLNGTRIIGVQESQPGDILKVGTLEFQILFSKDGVPVAVAEEDDAGGTTFSLDDFTLEDTQPATATVTDETAIIASKLEDTDTNLNAAADEVMAGSTAEAQSEAEADPSTEAAPAPHAPVDEAPPATEPAAEQAPAATPVQPAIPAQPVDVAQQQQQMPAQPMPQPGMPAQPGMPPGYPNQMMPGQPMPGYPPAMPQPGYPYGAPAPQPFPYGQSQPGYGMPQPGYGMPYPQPPVPQMPAGYPAQPAPPQPVEYEDEADDYDEPPDPTEAPAVTLPDPSDTGLKEEKKPAEGEEEAPKAPAPNPAADILKKYKNRR